MLHGRKWTTHGTWSSDGRRRWCTWGGLLVWSESQDEVGGSYLLAFRRCATPADGWGGFYARCTCGRFPSAGNLIKLLPSPRGAARFRPARAKTTNAVQNKWMNRRRMRRPLMQHHRGPVVIWISSRNETLLSRAWRSPWRWRRRLLEGSVVH